jgi:hypothetical protein
MPPPADRPKGRPPRITLTAEQEAKLRELWPVQSVSGKDIRAAINAFDGPQITNDGTLYSVAHRLDLGVRGALWAERASGKAAYIPDEAAAPRLPAAEPAAIAEPSPTREAHDSSEPPAMPQDKREAFEGFDAGQTVRDVAADLGIPLSTLSNWHAEWKLARKREAAGTTAPFASAAPDGSTTA